MEKSFNKVKYERDMKISHFVRKNFPKLEFILKWFGIGNWKKIVLTVEGQAPLIVNKFDPTKLSAQLRTN